MSTNHDSSTGHLQVKHQHAMLRMGNLGATETWDFLRGNTWKNMETMENPWKTMGKPGEKSIFEVGEKRMENLRMLGLPFIIWTLLPIGGYAGAG